MSKKEFWNGTLSFMKWIRTVLCLGIFAFAEERTQVHMGTLISVKSSNASVIDEVFALFVQLDQTLSTYKADSEISRLNAVGTLEVSDSTREILERSIEMSRLSGGVFDVTIGTLTHGAYRFGKTERIPTSDQLREGVKHVGYRQLRLKGNHASLSAGSIIDLGGIGKGFAVDQAMDLLQKRGVKEAVVAASGDIGCIGACRVSITDPFRPQGIYKTLYSSWPRFAISTSGNYERYIKHKGYNHLLNPKTGDAEQLFASVTLYGPDDNTKLDALATAVAIMPLDKALALLKREKIGYVLMLNNGTIYQSPLPQGIVWSE